eukprot:GEZU01005344.1.p1 GENE.GEZU01005344.1~~GEZU01005344.1.p1  ORF type:complete len:217 (-),score=25.03 GEZU01005344.1:249-899(-)
MSTVRSNQGDVASTTSASSYASTVLVHSSSSQSQQHQHQQPIPQQRQVAFVERLIFNFEGSVGHNALFLADVDNDGCIEFVIGSVWGTLSIFKFRGSNPYFSCSGLGSISCILVDKVGTRKTNVLCVVSAEGEAHFFDLTSRTTTTTTTTTTTATAILATTAIMVSVTTFLHNPAPRCRGAPALQVAADTSARPGLRSTGREEHPDGAGRSPAAFC